MKQLLSQRPDGLQLVHKLAKSFADSIVQSTAPLTMRPQQQALCAVCHALMHYGMPREAVLQHYAAAASSKREAGADEGGAAVTEALAVCFHSTACRQYGSSWSEPFSNALTPRLAMSAYGSSSFGSS